MVAEGTNANMTYEERYVDKVRHLIRTILGLDGVLIFTQTQIFHLSHHNYPYDLQMKECKAQNRSVGSKLSVLGHSFLLVPKLCSINQIICISQIVLQNEEQIGGVWRRKGRRGRMTL